MVTIGLDLSFLAGARTGIGTYAAGLCRALQEAAPPDLDLLAWTGLRLEPLGRWAEVAAQEPGEEGTASWRLRALLRRAGPLYHAARRLRDRLAPGCDVFHALNFVPSHRVRGLVIPTIHDLAHLRHPEFLPPERAAHLRARSGMIRRAPAIHTVSAFSKAELIDLLGIPPERIHVIPPAAEPDLPAAHGPERVPYGLDRDRFLLSIGTLEPRKNLRTLVTAFLALAPEERRHCPLAVAGPAGWGSLDLPAATAAAAAAGEIRFLGYVPRAELRALLAAARALAYPSLYEGFGMPVLEALSAGTPALVSRAPALAEAGCGRARVVETLDVEAWTEALRETIAASPSAACREALRREAAARYGWDRSAEGALRLYRHVREAGK